MHHGVGRVVRSVMLLCTLGACKDLVSNVDLPTDVLNPNVVKNENGAIGLYRANVLAFRGLFGGASPNSDVASLPALTGLLSDELERTSGRYVFPQVLLDFVDSRLLYLDNTATQLPNETYFAALNGFRLNTQEARGMIRKYAPNLPQALLGNLLAMEGYITILLGDIYCSGIPLGRIDFEQNYTLSAGLTTAEVYRRAIALFDSADVYVADSARLKSFVQVGRARALLALGDVAAARAQVTAVPTNYEYRLEYAGTDIDMRFVPNTRFTRFSDVEGQNGLPFRTAGDPRTQLTMSTEKAGWTTISSGIEARLIDAEALLASGDSQWLIELNRLRTTCELNQPCLAPAPAGSGGIAGLAPIADPAGNASNTDTSAFRKRLDLIFTERAYWLFLTAHRHGDLRRLVRNYNRSQQTVYPIGPYWATSYGTYVNLSIPKSEEQLNPLYRGCFDRNP